MFHSDVASWLSEILHVTFSDVDREDPGRLACGGDTNTSHAASVVHSGPPTPLDTPPC